MISCARCVRCLSSCCTWESFKGIWAKDHPKIEHIMAMIINGRIAACFFYLFVTFRSGFAVRKGQGASQQRGIKDRFDGSTKRSMGAEKYYNGHKTDKE